jgi:hypothetical protein
MLHPHCSKVVPVTFQTCCQAIFNKTVTISEKVLLKGQESGAMPVVIDRWHQNPYQLIQGKYGI